ncbi:hypothetical protein K491DRAFT_692834 [Lophiostoma macrostomum CBS 122681]|uniref:Uncharacterized protein n=1 Tax=Lophiostoma macrostomum CBS 122681 TaxID=1314788 RepID=A0A6A6TA89_9PLEO|nr:hypothetical protein K491DRAFT_692834 [Lophiostoma macrostomum CBS 122681]
MAWNEPRGRLGRAQNQNAIRNQPRHQIPTAIEKDSTLSPLDSELLFKSLRASMYLKKRKMMGRSNNHSFPKSQKGSALICHGNSRIRWAPVFRTRRSSHMQRVSCTERLSCTERPSRTKRVPRRRFRQGKRFGGTWSHFIRQRIRQPPF